MSLAVESAMQQKTQPPLPLPERLRDGFGRTISDLRVSVTDRCNYRCVYCRTGNDGARSSELGIADYLRMTRLFVSLGIEKVRLTGGEPLLRAGLVEMVQELAHMPTAEGASLDLALTTNGHLLAGLAEPLKRAGLGRVTVSMDAVDPETFTAITRVPRSFDRVLAGIRAAAAAGLGPVKVNCVLLRGFNDSQIEQFAEFSRREGAIVRFIEWMPLEEPVAGDASRSWRRETVVTLDEIVARLSAWRPLVELPPNAASETARRYTFDDGSEKSELWRRCRGRSAAIAAASGSRRMERFAPACFRSRITIFTGGWPAGQPTPSCGSIFGRLCYRRRRGTTSASPAS